MIDAIGCEAAALADGGRLRAFCQRAIVDLDLHVVGEPQWHQFPSPGGWTGMYLLSESHLTCHTFPELGLATFNLYCCRPRAAWAWETQLAKAFGAQQVDITAVPRGSSVIARLEGDRQ
ncbi:MAG TPA: S-adenosylmethionine decarboxylase [Pirellulaceae bacterium]|nr:S-adenosylmethionine decarboxylase [Pirellulaceae bacterium]